MSCEPSYPYTPTFTPSATDCVAPIYARRRSRAIIPGMDIVTPLFFRSVGQSFDANQVEIELVDLPTGEFRVYFEGALVASYPVLFQAGAIAALRLAITSDPNTIIEMPVVGFDIFDERMTEEDGDGGVSMIAGLGPFDRTFFEGGEGAPDDATLASIRTGPQRTIYIIRSEEDLQGNDVEPPGSRRIQQWNGFAWISYCNTVPGQCPGEGTC